MEINILIKMWDGSACRVVQAHTVLFIVVCSQIKTQVLPGL